MNSNCQNPVNNPDRLPDPPTPYIIFIDGNMAGKELKCSCGRIYAWLDKANIMTSEARNDPIISAFLKSNNHYDTSKDNHDLYSSHSNQRYCSPPRISDRDYYRYNGERSRRSTSPYHHSQSRYSNHRERRRSVSYSESRSRSRSPSGRRRSYHYHDENYTRSRDKRYEVDINREYLVNPNQVPVIQYANQPPMIKQQQPPQMPSIQPIVQPSIQSLPPRQIQSLPLQNQQPTTTTSPPVNNNNNKQTDSWTSVNKMDNVWASYDDVKPSSSSPLSSSSRVAPPSQQQQQQQRQSLREDRMNNFDNMNNESFSSPMSDSDNSSTNSNYQEIQPQQQQQQQSVNCLQDGETVPKENKVWEIPLPIHELCHRYPGKTMDDVGRDQLITDLQDYNFFKGLNSDHDSVAHTVDYQMTKNRVLLRLEFIVQKISSLYEEKYGEKLDLQKDLGFKKLSKCLETYGFTLHPMQNLTVVSPSNRKWF